MEPRSPSSMSFAVQVALAAFALSPLAAQDLVADEVAAKVRAVVEPQLGKKGAVGLSVGIGQHGAVLFTGGFGRADVEAGTAVDAATMFRIGSVTKQFTAAALLRFVARGKLKLDDPLAQYVPTFATGGKTVTLRQLLTHTAGIPNYTEAGPLWGDTMALELTHEKLLATVAGKPLDFEPGTDFHYSNTGYYLLGMVLEKVAGKSYAEIVQEELAGPLGLVRTRYDSNKEVLTNRAQGYAFEDGKLQNDDPLGMSQPGAAGALLSTGGELVQWSMALAGGKVVDAEQFARMRRGEVLPSGRDTHYGFGLVTGDFEGKPVVDHAGGINGFNSMLMWLPDADLHIAVISNGERLSTPDIAHELARTLLGIAKFVAKDEPIDASLAASLAGKYHIADLDLGIAVTWKDGVLRAQGDGQGAFRLLWQGAREFRAEFDHSVKLVFDDKAESFELHQGGGVFHAAKKP